MLQSPASSLLNILSSKPVTSDALSQPVSVNAQQVSEFNRIYQGIGRGNATPAGLVTAAAKAENAQQLDLFSSLEVKNLSELSPVLQMDPALIEGQSVADDPALVGNVLPFHFALSTTALPQTEPEDTTAPVLPDQAWNGLTLGAAFFAIDAEATTASGLTDPLSLNPAASALDTGMLPWSDNESMLAEQSDLSGQSLLQPVGLADSAGATTSGDRSGKTPQSGQFVPPGLAQAVLNATKPAVKAAAADGVPAHVNSGLTAGELDGLELDGLELDAQWQERLRGFQQAQNHSGGMNSNAGSGYDQSTFMDDYWQNGGALLQDGAVDSAFDSDALLHAALKELDAGAGLVSEKSSTATNGLTVQANAPLRTTADAGLKSYTTFVSQPVSDDGWIDNMGEKIVWLSGRNIQSAEIHLNPAELGPVEVKVQMQNDQTTVTFTVQHASVRELLEANVHRLRELMEGNGVNLKDVEVSADTSGQQQAFARENGDSGTGQSHTGTSHDGSTHESLSDTDESVLVEQGSTAISSRQSIDFYA